MGYEDRAQAPVAGRKGGKSWEGTSPGLRKEWRGGAGRPLLQSLQRRPHRREFWEQVPEMTAARAGEPACRQLSKVLSHKGSGGAGAKVGARG